MGLSLKERVARMPQHLRLEFLDSLDADTLDMIAREEWFWVARPEQMAPLGDWGILLLLAGRGFGKALALSTMIATITGWKKLEEINPGDQVFDEQGNPCTVTATFDVNPDRAYRVEFSDGTFIDACREHQWATWTHVDRKALSRKGVQRFPAQWPMGHVRDTEAIAATLTYGKRGDRNHCVPLAGMLELPMAALPIDPYVLGIWLGDGSSNRAEVTTADPEIVRWIEGAGYRVVPVNQEAGKTPRYGIGGMPSQRDPATGRMLPNGSLTSVLREHGLLGNKHIPGIYLRAHATQRLALLQGLMDSDGYASSSHVEFCSTKPELANGVLELIRSLGQKPVMACSDAKLYGRVTSKRWRISWRPTICTFRLVRKAARVSVSGKQGLRNRHRMIMSVTPIAPEPMRCLTVDSPNSMYLAGEAMIPTHNTRSGAEWIVQRTLDFPYDASGFPTERLIMAYNISDAVATCAEGPSGVLRVLRRMGFEEAPSNRKIDDLEGRYSFTRSPKPYVKLLETGAVIHFSGATIDAARSKNLADVWLDEIVKWGNPEETWREGIRPALRADIPGDKPRALVTTTPKPIVLLKTWVTDPAKWKVHIVRGSTFDNAANLSEDSVEEMRQVYEGTQLGRQELYGELLDDVTGVLFSFSMIDKNRLEIGPSRVAHRCVGIDPGLTGDEKGDEMGVIVASRDHDDHMHVIADETVRLAGREAALHAWRIFEQYHCDTLVVEENLGKVWMREVFTDAFRELQKQGLFPSEIVNPPIVPVFSKHGKKLRAEPVAMRYAQGRVHHLGVFDKLETQMLTFDPLSSKESPDRLDALVHAIRHLIEGERRKSRIISPLNHRVPSLGYNTLAKEPSLGDYGIG